VSPITPNDALSASAEATQAVAAPEGWKLVPVEPDLAMVDAACPAGETVDHFDMKTALRAAIAAAPQAPADAARAEPVTSELLESARAILECGHQHDVGGGDVFISTCDAAERLERAIVAHAPPAQQAVSLTDDARDGERYRAFFDAGLPVTFLGVEYRDKASLDAAIDAALQSHPEGSRP